MNESINHSCNFLLAHTLFFPWH
uniref:Uncharacterized protein n=1 Tax=Rhizophora mucronata TaxID=61149 RepID=A0A2P2PDA5_RHIMU